MHQTKSVFRYMSVVIAAACGVFLAICTVERKATDTSSLRGTGLSAKVSGAATENCILERS